MNCIKKMIMEHVDVFMYLFFGVCTTAVNVIAYGITSHVLHQSVMLSTVEAWVLAVLFAYVTNRKWVFHSKVNGSVEIIREVTSFFACRLATGGVDIVCMYVFVELLHLNDIIIKFAANVLVIILNYIASKWIIFKKR